jgi:cyclic beta-1,2-glucan synthetase
MVALEPPIRAELFSVERLEQHAESLAAAQRLSPRLRSGRLLTPRLYDNTKVLIETYRAIVRATFEHEQITPAAEWLLDNFHVVDEQIREIKNDLPPGYYRKLPKLVDGPLQGYPRVFGIAWALVAHTDSAFDFQKLTRFVEAYQRVQPLTIGELWAIAITLRITLVENLRRLAEQIVARLAAGQLADKLADRILGTDKSDPEPASKVLQSLDDVPWSTAFAVQLAQRLRDRDPNVTPALRWLNDKLAAENTTTDEIVRDEVQRQSAMNVTVRNVITSMRLVSMANWAEFFESVSPVDAILRGGSDFAAMDFPTRDLYRRAIEDLAQGSGLDETEVARRIVAAAGHKRNMTPGDGPGREQDPGYYLIAKGRRAFEKEIGYRVPPGTHLFRIHARIGVMSYVGITAVLTTIILALAVACVEPTGIGIWAVLLLAFVGLIPASDIAVAIANRLITQQVGATLLPGLELREGVPPDLRTIVVVPTLLTSISTIREQIERLEVHHLSNPDSNFIFALLSDWRDADAERIPGDAPLFEQAAADIGRLNERYGPAASGTRFFLLHRRRVWNEGEGKWIGWERKRGKLHELNRLLRGANDTTFVAVDGRPPSLPDGVRYVITLDADTRLPIGAARRLVGKIAHPLNRARFDPQRGLVVQGYGILQPRVTPSLPIGDEGSLYQRVFSGPNGLDPYALAVSDVYQDLFDEGSYCGKGIYEIDVFEAALEKQIPENTVLSHDLLEGIFARAGLASDIEVVEEFPSRYSVAAARQHRWVRGDWQLIPWIFGLNGRLRGGSRKTPLPLMGRWKLIDNLRRSLSAPSALLAMLIAWLLPMPVAEIWTAFILLTIALPPLLPGFSGLIPHRRGVSLRNHLRAVGGDFSLGLLQGAFLITFLAHQAWMMLDAIMRTLFRVFIHRRRLLEWVPAAQANGDAQFDTRSLVVQISASAVFVVAVAIATFLVRSETWPVAIPLLALWVLSPLAARRASLPPPTQGHLAVATNISVELRLIARRTWRFFEKFVAAEDNMLPPDNFQEDPKPVIAHRTSPTNIGLYLLSVVAARDFGWLGTIDAVERLEATFATLDKLERFRGHFYNWYDTSDLRALEPKYVSSVDSGNLAGHLIALANACREIIDGPVGNPGWITGLDDHLALIRQSGHPDVSGRGSSGGARAKVSEKSMAMAMEFGFLFDPDRQLLSIGYRCSDGALDSNFYDLLASEARLASFFAIAKGDMPAKHWFRLGRTLTPIDGGSGLISWSGSMFEYLMPSLVMRAPAGSLLKQTNRLVVSPAGEYGGELGVPWGMSESEYQRARHRTNLSIFELRRSRSRLQAGPQRKHRHRALCERRLPPWSIRPPRRANLQAHGGHRRARRYGWYEAIDYTRARLPEGAKFAIVRAYMAHHQAMTIVGIANALHDGRMRARFHAEPMVQAAELLLQERMPRDVAVARPPPEQVAAATREASLRTGRDPAPLRVGAFACSAHAAAVERPIFRDGDGRRLGIQPLARHRDHALARGRHLRWLGRLHLPARRAQRRNLVGRLPADGVEPDSYEVVFSEDRAEIVRNDGIDHHHAGNRGFARRRRGSAPRFHHQSRNAHARNRAHVLCGNRAGATGGRCRPSRFRQAVRGNGVRARPRRDSGDTAAAFVGDPQVWAAHLAVVEGESPGDVQFETDRARFLGRGQTIRAPSAIVRRLAAFQHGRRRARSDLQPAPAREDPARRHRAHRVLDHGRRHARRDHRSRRQASRCDRVRARNHARLDAGADAASPSRHRYGRGASVPAPRQSCALFRPHPATAPEVLKRGARKIVDLWAQGISGDLPIVLVRIEETTIWNLCASCCALTNIGG